MYLVHAKYLAVIEAALARAVKDLAAAPEFGIDEKAQGWIAVGVMRIQEPVILSVQ